VGAVSRDDGADAESVGVMLAWEVYSRTCLTFDAVRQVMLPRGLCQPD